MRRFIVASCCVIVGLQILIGVPALACLSFLLCFEGSRLGPASVEIRAATSPRPLDPPALSDAPAEPTAQNDSILEARHQRGSLLAGTMLDANLPAAEEQREFVAAFQQVAAESLDAMPAPANLLPDPICGELNSAASSDLLQASADRFAVEHLYLIAEQDEQAGLFERSDQWRGLARAIRRPPIEATDNSCLSGADLCPVDATAQ